MDLLAREHIRGTGPSTQSAFQSRGDRRFRSTIASACSHWGFEWTSQCSAATKWIAPSKLPKHAIHTTMVDGELVYEA